MVVPVLVGQCLSKGALPYRFQHKVRSERENAEHHVPVKRDNRVARELTGQVGQSGVSPVDHHDSPRPHFRHAVDLPKLPRTVPETPESRFQAAVLRVGAYTREKPVTDDEATAASLHEDADFRNGIGRIFSQLDDLGEFKDCLEWRCGDGDLRLFAGHEEYRHGDRDQGPHARPCHPESTSAGPGRVWPGGHHSAPTQLTGRSRFFRMNRPSCMLVTMTVPLSKYG